MIQSTVPASRDALTSSPTSTAPLGVASLARPPETDRNACVHSGSVSGSARYLKASSNRAASSTVCTSKSFIFPSRSAPRRGRPSVMLDSSRAGCVTELRVPRAEKPAALPVATAK
jgi:hypothetical protein